MLSVTDRQKIEMSRRLDDRKSKEESVYQKRMAHDLEEEENKERLMEKQSIN
jgi:hypothetical protein